MKNISTKFITSITEVPEQHYQDLITTEYPFIQYQFLLALESSKAVSKQTGWTPCHLLIEQKNRVIAFVPLYLKEHSYGEYVFDFEWAQAYQDYGINYYPKLVTAIPFTPVTGCRICHHPEVKIEPLVSIIIEQIKRYAITSKASSWHLLFPQRRLSQLVKNNQLLQRTGVQFHWLNRDYQHFDDFINQLKSKRRKQIRRERKKITQQGIKMSAIEGKDIDPSLWKQFHQFYQLTYAKRSGHGGYLPASFFVIIGQSMPEKLILVTAYDGPVLVAAALFFKDSDSLYGRYWGCSREYDFLHFEACYYQGIEYCINHNLKRFDAGAQGEHKIQRGFEPTTTYSNHWIEEPAFSQAIEHFLSQESIHTKHYLIAAQNKLPFKKTPD